MLKQKYFLADIFILSAEKQPIKSSWRKIEWLHVASDKYSDLHNLCNTFLQNKGRDPIDFPQSLYAFRNFIVHDFRYMTEDKNIVSDVNYLFEQYILYLLLGYKHMDI